MNWAYQNILDHKGDFDLLDELSEIDKMIRNEVFNGKRRTSTETDVENVDLAVLTYLTFAHHTFESAKLNLEFGFPVVTANLTRSIFEIRLDLIYLLDGAPSLVAEKGRRYIEHSQAYVQHFAKKIYSKEALSNTPKYQEFEAALSQFEKNWNIQEKKELEHWSGLNVWERCSKVKLGDHYDQFRWLSQSSHLSPIVLEFFVRNVETGYEYLEGPSNKRTSEYTMRLVLTYAIVCAQPIDWFGLWKLRDQMEIFSKKMILKVNSELNADQKNSSKS